MVFEPLLHKRPYKNPESTLDLRRNGEDVYIRRALVPLVRRHSEYFKDVAVIGPRQVGKGDHARASYGWGHRII